MSSGMTFEDFLQTDEMKGFEPFSGDAVDRIRVESKECYENKCLGSDMEYHAYWNRITRTYRGFAVCKICSFFKEL